MMMDNNILESLEALTPLDVKDLPFSRIELIKKINWKLLSLPKSRENS